MYTYIYTHVYVIKGILVRNFSVNLELLHEIIHEKSKNDVRLKFWIMTICPYGESLIPW